MASVLRTRRLAFATTVVLTLLAAARVSFAGDEQLIPDARQTIAKFRRTDPGLNMFFEHAAGYAVFPGIGKGGYLVGGAHGTGVLFEDGVPIGKVTLNQVTVGAQAGGQEYSEVIFFETPRALAEFKQGKSAFSAQVSAVALKAGASATAKYERGVAIFTATKGGMMAEASVGGQKFKFEPFAR
jgi:lipid-binding SYLF domain-containing protein